MITYAEFVKKINEETTAGDIASTDGMKSKEVKKRELPGLTSESDDALAPGTDDDILDDVHVTVLANEIEPKVIKTEIVEMSHHELPEDVLRRNNIKVKSVDMDDQSYVILVYSTEDARAGVKVLEEEGFVVAKVNKLLYIS